MAAPIPLPAPVISADLPARRGMLAQALTMALVENVTSVTDVISQIIKQCQVAEPHSTVDLAKVRS
jgi:hypothetical protein